MNDKSLTRPCPACYARDVNVFYELKNVPVHSVLVSKTKDEALSFKRGDIALGFCARCGFIFNTSYDSDLQNYSTACEESQSYSATFNEFSLGLAKDLIKRHKLYRKNIIEIGCGKGDFLTLLCEIGDNKGIGFDPAFVPGRVQSKALENITFIQDFYSDKYAHLQADFICCKMTLEHILETSHFMNSVRQAVKEKSESVIFFQIPDVTRILRNAAFEDIYYEHCSYFSPGSLARLFRSHGFDILDIRIEYADQYLVIESRPAPGLQTKPVLPLEEDMPGLLKYVKEFSHNFLIKKNNWEKKLTQYTRDNKRCVLWGSGSKAVSFLTTLSFTDNIDYVVDINPYRQGTFMAGTGQLIVAPEFLGQYHPDAVILMNPIYYFEVKETLQAMGLNPEILSL